ncbi:hypothetical protein Zmor_002159 [Zophobas morio]|uniref:Amine oxidase domain-containing protein n=4 Tax=Zophobas morio TaxID=2755281 RepID=A0AA38MTD8_9CUCU|nr:hypothetical protein Zmor_002159 [Zophobas morio]
MSASPKVIIIGAGAAGIAAASVLVENGVNDVIILEAENRIGGRINSVEFDGRTVDLGAQWCHGEKDNIVYKMTKNLDLLGSSVNNYKDFTFYSSNGEVLDKSLTDDFCALANSVFENEDHASKFGGTFGHYFIHEYTRNVSEILSKKPRAEEVSELLLEWFHKAWMGLEAAQDWFSVSTTGPYRYQECEGDLYLHWKSKGYTTIFDILTKKIPNPVRELPVKEKILFRKEVTKIVWDSGNDVTVECSDGSSYTCDQLIVTVSLGVLKHMLHNFVPPLPDQKQTAIKYMAFGNIHKILLKFPSAWWPADSKGFSFVWNKDDRQQILKDFAHGPVSHGRLWLEDIYGFYVIDDQPNVLVGWLVGEMVEKVEMLSDDLVMDGCMHLLRKFVGKTFDITPPNGMLRFNWKNNPHFRGAYSYMSLETETNKISNEDLADPVINSKNNIVLLFAGEATHSKYYSTVHGAIETGFREANRIINIYK